MIEVREATPDDLHPIAAALARAFQDDPVATWLIEGHRQSRMRRFYRGILHDYLRRARVLTTPGHQGAALWAPPGAWRTPWTEIVRSAPNFTMALGTRFIRGLRALSQMERAHPRQDHWYLAILGTDPPAQGKGVGGALMAPILERCDREGLPAYLESSKESNIPYYERYGFAVTGEVRFPKGPTMWPMWREPAERGEAEPSDQPG